MKEGKFGVAEAVCLVTITIVSKVFYTSPTTLTQIVGTADWYMTLISAVTSICAFYLIVKLLKKYPDKNLIEIYNEVFGKTIGFVMSIILMLWLLFLGSMNMREFTEVIQVYAMPDSPTLFIMGHFSIVVAVVCYLGLEALVRASKLFSYGVLFGLILVLVLCQQNYNLNGIFPILGYGFDKTIYNGFVRSSAYGEIIILAIFASSLQGINYIKRAGYVSLILSGALVSLSLLAFNLTFPYTVGSELTASMYEMISLVDYSMFFQRLEGIFLFVWYTTSFITMSALCYSSFFIFCSSFRIEDKRPIIVPFIIIFISIGMIPNGISDIAYGAIPVARNYGWIIYYIPPILALLAATFMKRRKEGQNVS